MKTKLIAAVPAFMMTVAQAADHTDGGRERAYDVTPLGRFEKDLAEADAKGWTVVNMKQDWKAVFPFEKK